MHAHSQSSTPSFWRAVIICGACIYAAHAAGADAAAFPFLITAFTSVEVEKRQAKHVVSQLCSHLISAAAAVMLGALQPHGAAIWSGVPNAAPLAGVATLIAVQFTRLRHPPAMASGGAVLYGVEPAAVVGCAAITGFILFFEPFILRFWRPQR